jgi:hypothetical protein
MTSNNTNNGLFVWYENLSKDEKAAIAFYTEIPDLDAAMNRANKDGGHRLEWPPRRPYGPDDGPARWRVRLASGCEELNAIEEANRTIAEGRVRAKIGSMTLEQLRSA